MTIGVIGWYGRGNAGDDRMLYCLKRYFNEQDFFVASGFGDAEQKIDQLNSCDYVLIGGGGIILRGFGKYARLIEQIRPNLGCIGISVESAHKDNQALIDIILDRSDFVLVRDSRSKELLKHYKKVIVGPDITYLYPFETIIPTDQDICGINLRAWHLWHWEHGSRISKFLNSLRGYLPNLSQIYPLRKWSPQQAYDILSKKFEEIYPIPLFTIPNKKKSDIYVLEEFFQNVPIKFNPDDYKSGRYFVGMRLHSVIFAAQMGIPFLSLSYQPKNIEFCKSIDLVNLSIDLYNLPELNKKIDFIKENFNIIRNQLICHRNEKNREISSIMDQLAPIMLNSGR